MGVQWHSTITEFKKVYDSIRREILYSIWTGFGIPKKQVRLLTVHLTVTYRKVCTGKHLSDIFLVQNCFKQGNTISPLLFSFGLKYDIMNLQVKETGLHLNGTNQLMVYVDIDLLGRDINTTKEETKTIQH
jgi:hypothetical protein